MHTKCRCTCIESKIWFFPCVIGQFYPLSGTAFPSPRRYRQLSRLAPLPQVQHHHPRCGRFSPSPACWLASRHLHLRQRSHTGLMPTRRLVSLRTSNIRGPKSLSTSPYVQPIFMENNNLPCFFCIANLFQLLFFSTLSPPSFNADLATSRSNLEALSMWIMRSQARLRRLS